MSLHIGLGALLLIITTAVHASAMVLAVHGLQLTHADRWAARSAVTRIGLVSSVVIIMFLASFLESGIWALTYMATGAISSLEEALYFSMVTFTTLGYGDITLNDQWRLLSSFEAANGTIMFGWTTALIVTAAHKLYLHRDDETTTA